MKGKFSKFLIFFIMLILIALNIGNVKGNIYLACRSFPKAIIINRTKNFKEIHTEHFTIRYKSEDEDIVELVAESAEKYFDEICSRFGYYPKKKTLIIVYNNGEELLKNANLGECKPPMGVYYASTIQILSPKLWTGSSQDMEYLFMNEGPLIHEFTHLVVDDIAKGNYPLWFTEGVALYEEYETTGYEWGKEIVTEKIYTVDQLSNQFNSLNQYLAYTQSFRIVKHMVDKYGFQCITEILNKLEEGYSFDRAFKMVTDDEISSLNV